MQLKNFKSHQGKKKIYECRVTGNFSTWEVTGDFGKCDFSGVEVKKTDFSRMKDDKK